MNNKNNNIGPKIGYIDKIMNKGIQKKIRKSCNKQSNISTKYL